MPINYNHIEIISEADGENFVYSSYNFRGKHHF